MAFHLTENQQELKQIIENSEPSFPSTYAFNFLPSRYIHEAWFKKLMGATYQSDIREKIIGSAADARLNQYILKTSGLEKEYCYDFDDFGRRLALMPNQELMKIIKIIGAVPYLNDLKKIIDKKHLERVKSMLGKDTYEFLINRLPFLLSENQLKLLQAIKVSPFEIDTMEKHCQFNGVNFLLIWIKDQPPAISQRMRLKFDPGTKWEIDKKFKHLDMQIIQTVFKKIIREVVPSWRHLFV